MKNDLRSVIFRIISGGQTGVDRAALDFALNRGIPCGGYCPAGRLAEDGRIPDHYPLRETSSSDYTERTEKNVRESDGTLVFYSGTLTGGTQYTYLFARSLCKPLFACDLDKPMSVNSVNQWIRTKRIAILNIAGPRESQVPGIHRLTLERLGQLFP